MRPKPWSFTCIVFSACLVGAWAPHILRGGLQNLSARSGPNSAHVDFADPSLPDTHDPNLIRVYGTAGEVLTWPRKNPDTSVSEILTGEIPKHERLRVCHNDGSLFNEEAGEDLWDPTVEVDLADGRTEILYGGAMTPPPGKKFATWPDDNWSRRTYAFLKKDACWRMQKTPLWAARPKVPTWIDHNYGHAFMKDEDGQTYVFYERVSDDTGDQPWQTEIFARRMKTSLRTDEKEIPIFLISQRPWPALRRDSGGALAEGPRPFKALGKYFISFSAGEYASEHYGIHLLWADRIDGPYQPYLNAQGTDLEDFGRDINKLIPMEWGPGRAAFFESDGKWWALFHGIAKSARQEGDGHRSIYLTPVAITPGGAGQPPRVRVGP